MNKRLEIIKYIISDYLSSALAWCFFFVFRKKFIEYPYILDWQSIQNNEKFWTGVFLIPIGWVLLYAVQGLYHNVYRKSRLKEFAQVLVTSLLGTLVLFFLFVLDDKNDNNYTAYYKSLSFLFIAQFLFNGVSRYLITTRSARRIHKGKIGFNTIMIGSNEKAVSLFNELQNAKKSAGYKFKGFLSIDPTKEKFILSEHLELLGSYEDANQVIKANDIEEVIIALETNEHEVIKKILTNLQESDVRVRIIPDLYNILTGQVKMNSILHAALIEVTIGNMSAWQVVVKRLMDILISVFVLVIGFPFYLILALLVKLSSKGPVFFSQERIGLRGKPFRIYKFRSMYLDAEKDGPALSKDKDARITPIGRFLRKSRLDETPQFWNVLKGDMSLVGPRPERMFFIDQIVSKAPQYKYLHKVKPGITSWGQVKYGYAENVDEMIDRLKYDLIYLENRSLLIDFKILIYTILVVIQGRGK